jgi:hypothetical protein
MTNGKIAAAMPAETSPPTALPDAVLSVDEVLG